jgi:surface antigen
MRKLTLLLILTVSLSACVATATVHRATVALFGEVDPALTETDQQKAFEAAEFALKTGKPNQWLNPENGHKGTITPGPERKNGQYGTCRDFSHKIRTEGLPYTIKGTACRGPDDVWRVVSA